MRDTRRAANDSAGQPGPRDPDHSGIILGNNLESEEELRRSRDWRFVAGEKRTDREIYRRYGCIIRVSSTLSTFSWNLSSSESPELCAQKCVFWENCQSAGE